MPKKLIVGSPQAMDREPPLDECDIMDQGTARDPMPPTTEELADLDEEEDLFCLPTHRVRCDNPECWCNNPRWKKKSFNSHYGNFILP